jgi:SAM-dependent methyltransferase
MTGDATARFGDRVADYVKYRPSYPKEIVTVLEREHGLTKDVVVADVGSGTGISTRIFLAAGYEVIGVEPNAPMRAAAERDAAAFPHFRSVDGTAEATTLPDASVGLVLAAQAFHWFDVEKTRLEWARITRTPKLVALVWNERTMGSPFLQAYEALLIRVSPDYAAVRHQDRASPEVVRAFFATPPREHVFPNAQTLDRDGHFGRALSSSYVPKSGPAHDEVMRGLEELWNTYGAATGSVTWTYDTRMYVSEL